MMNIKLFLLILAIVITAGTFYYTQDLVGDLEESERQIVKLYANSLEFIADPSTNSNEDFTFVFQNIIKRINFPLILTDAESNPLISNTGSGIRNIELIQLFLHEELKNFLKIKLKN